MHHRSGLSLFALVIASFSFAGCSGLVAGNNGNTSPSTLVITNVQTASVTTSSSQVAWTTNVPADSSVDYGTTAAYGNSTPVNSAMVTNHQTTLSGLSPGTTYYYQVNSTDSKGYRGHGANKFNTAGFSLSGTISPAAGGSGTNLTLSGAASSTTTADNVGNYTFAALPNGTYTIAPNHAGFAFTPSSQSMTVNGANVTGVNFTANATPVAPTITTQPASQTVTAGQTASFSVAATGTAPLTYQWQKNSVTISGATSSSYTTPATTTSDNAAQFTVVVSNSAGSVTSSAATLTVSAAQISVVPTSVSFGNVVTGNTDTQTIKLTNSGAANLTLSQAPVTGNGFSISGLTLPLTLNPGQSTNFNVAFAPAGAGNATGSVSLVGNASNSPLAIPLTGAGAAATFLLSANPTSLAFGAVNVGSNSPLGATLTNNGNSNVTISGVTVSGTGFSASGVTAGTTLTPNQSVTLNVTFAPTAAGSLIGTVTVAGNATNSPAIIALSGIGAATNIINVTTYGATGNGSTDDTAAIKNAISALTSGATLLFPCGTYKTSSQLTLNISNITVDGSGCAVIHNISSGTVMVISGSGNGNPNYGPAVALSATANELATNFTTVSSLGVAAGDYVLLQQGGKDSSTGSGDTGCDPSGCRGELLKVASVSGNAVTITTAVHDTYNPSVNAATAQKILGPVTGVTVKNITFDGNGSNVYGLTVAGVAESTLTGVTSKNVQGAALLNRGDFNVAWSNITVTGAGSAQCGSAVWFEKEGNLSVNGMSISNENQGASGTGCLYNGAFGFEIQASANSTITNLTVDAAGAYGRPFKTSAARYNTFNSSTVKNGVQNYNGISLEYYSSHNTFNNCVVTNNGAGAGTGNGNAGINTFGNFNQYNTFNNCTVTGNGNVQVVVNSFDALRLGQDSNNTISGGTFTGTNGVAAVIEIAGANVYITGATISGPGSSGIQLDSSYGTSGCINNNTFTAGTGGMGRAINSGSSTNIGLGNILNGLSSNLTAGTCGPSSAVSILPTVATVASGGTQQFTATVTGSTNTAVTWSATAGSVSSSGLFTAPTVSTNTTVTVTATSQALTSQSASASVTVTPSAPSNTFGYAAQGANVGSTMSNSVLATRYQMVGQNGTVTSMSVFIASPVSVAPNNQFQVAIYADNSGAPGALIASSVSLTIVPDAWNTVPISAPVAANTYYWLAYNTNGLAANTNNLRYDVGGATSTWITSDPFGTWPTTYGPVGGSNSTSTSMYATFQ